MESLIMPKEVAYFEQMIRPVHFPSSFKGYQAILCTFFVVVHQLAKLLLLTLYVNHEILQTLFDIKMIYITNHSSCKSITMMHFQ